MPAGIAALTELYFDQIVTFVLVLTRISGLMMAAPVLGASNVPVRIRVLLAFTISLLITPVFWGTSIERPANVLHLMTYLANELMLGLSLGLGVAILFGGLQIAGQVAGQMSGMHLANAFDPAFESEVPIFSQMLKYVALAVYVLIGGHRMLMDALLGSFQWCPPGHAVFADDLAHVLVEIVSQSFHLGLRAAAPAMVALMLSILVMGLISRTLPQLNVLAVGFSLNSMMMLSVLSIAIGAIAWTFADNVGPTIDSLREVLMPRSV